MKKWDFFQPLSKRPRKASRHCGLSTCKNCQIGFAAPHPPIARCDADAFFAPRRWVLSGGVEDGDAGKFLAFHPFQEGAAGGRDIGEIVGNAGMVERRDGVAATGNRGQLSGCGALSGIFRGSDGCGIEGLDFEGAERTVPDERCGALDPSVDSLDRFRPDVEQHGIGGNSVDIDRRAGRTRLEFAGDHTVFRQDDGAACSRGLDHDLLGGLGEIMFAERLADIGAAGGDEGVGHAAADDERVDLLDEVHQQVDLGRDLGTADNCDHRADRGAEAFFQRFQLGLHGAPGIGRQVMGKALGRGMGAVSGGEGVVDINIAVGGKRLGEVGIVLFLAFVEARVFQKQDITVIHRGDGGGGGLAGAVGRRRHGVIEHFLDGGGNQRQRQIRRRAVLRSAEMGEQDHLGALLGQFEDRRRHTLDARRIGDLAILDRNVEVDADEHALAADVGEIVEGLECRHGEDPVLVGGSCADHSKDHFRRKAFNGRFRVWLRRLRPMLWPRPRRSPLRGFGVPSAGRGCAG
ncbi:hypothetical protein RHECNPAF_770084 [Rhizobium etli CNPAF512]|nr:hypothetical protein RHECNPAF_770084 [Rhizobium etli CNPAF512]